MTADKTTVQQQPEPRGDARPGPVMIELDAAEAEGAEFDPASAPPVPDVLANADQPSGQAMQTIAALGARRTPVLMRVFWAALLSLAGFVLSITAWDFVTGLLSRNAVLGGIAVFLTIVVLLALLALALREAAAFWRLARLDGIHTAADAATASGDLGAAQKVVDQLERLYAGRADLAWGISRLRERRADQFDADAVLGLAEVELMTSLDKAAQQEVATAARQVATVTAIVPLALADVVTALTANLRMIRRIAEIYGGRAGTLGSWRLTRTVLTHLVATGAVSVGDDLIHSVLGGGLVGRISRRFGEGVVNGALTARVGVAAIEVCRPLPFVRQARPSVTVLVQRALTGLFSRGNEGPADAPPAKNDRNT